MSAINFVSLDPPLKAEMDDDATVNTDGWTVIVLKSDHVRQKAIAFIDRHMSSPHLRPSFVAKCLRVPRSTLYSAFLADGGLADFLHERRLAKAKSALEAGAGEPAIVDRVARAHGYRDAEHFSPLFASRFGEQPTQFLQNARVPATTPEAAGLETTSGFEFDRPASNVSSDH